MKERAILYKMPGFRLQIEGKGRAHVDRDVGLFERDTMALWLLSVIIAVIGVVQLLQGQILLAIVLFVVAALVGPGGYSIFSGRRRAV